MVIRQQNSKSQAHLVSKTKNIDVENPYINLNVTRRFDKHNRNEIKGDENNFYKLLLSVNIF